MIIGSAAKQFRSKIVFTLAPDPNGRQGYTGSFNPPADPDNRRGLGHKAFVVMGGYIDFHGMPGGPDTPSWVKLAETADVGQDYIAVDADVSASWPVGGRWRWPPPGFTVNRPRTFLITPRWRPTPRAPRPPSARPLSGCTLGTPRAIPDGFGGFVDERAEVALLSRNIVLTGGSGRTGPVPV